MPEPLQALESNDQGPRNVIFNELVEERTKEITELKKKWLWPTNLCNNNRETLWYQ